MSNTVDPLTLTSSLAQQTDRWLFLFALVVLAVVAWMMVRYLVMQHKDIVQQYREDTKEYHRKLEGFADKGMETHSELSATLKENTLLLGEVKTVIERCKVKQF